MEAVLHFLQYEVPWILIIRCVVGLVVAGNIFMWNPMPISYRQINDTLLRMEKMARTRLFPKGELAQSLQSVSLQEDLWMDTGAKMERSALEQFSVEEELQSAYYLRTRNVVGDVYRNVPLERWYQPEEWIQDIIAGKLSIDTVLESMHVPEEEAEKTSGNKTKK